MAENHNQVKITAPCRIHLGLLSVRENQGRRFGGAGVMLERPALKLSVRRADADTCRGPLATRTAKFLHSWRDHTHILTPVHCEVHTAPPEHVGLGLGTQLGMSVATALDLLFGREEIPISERAHSVNRGLRSAVGAHGFQSGGLIIENGKRNGEFLGELAAQVELPAAWRVMLVRMRDKQGLAGDAELEAFHALTQSNHQDHSAVLRETLFKKLLPAAQTGDFEEFSECVYQYGFAAGELFAERQGGPFLNESIAQFVDFCRGRGVRGVGQSSWGPTVFCWFPNELAAQAFKTEHVLGKSNLQADVIVTAVSRTGADVRISQDAG